MERQLTEEIFSLLIVVDLLWKNDFGSQIEFKNNTNSGTVNCTNGGWKIDGCTA
jgi:hypothetical protein